MHTEDYDLCMCNQYMPIQMCTHRFCVTPSFGEGGMSVYVGNVSNYKLLHSIVRRHVHMEALSVFFFGLQSCTDVYP